MAIPRSMNPRGSVTDPRPKVSVPKSVRSRGSATQRAVAATGGGMPRLGKSLSEDVAAYRAGAPQELTSAATTARESRQQAEQSYYGMQPYKAGEFTRESPRFDPSAVQRIMPSLMIVSAFGGKLSRLNALTQMKALNAAVEGYNQGNVDAHKRAMDDWRQAYSEFKDREATRREQYDIQRNAAKDGLQMAINRQADADKAVADWNENSAKNINMQLALNQERRNAEMHAQNMLYKEAETEAKRTGKRKKVFGQAKRDKILNTLTIVDAMDKAIKTMQEKPEDFSTDVNSAFTYGPKVAEAYGLLRGGKTKAALGSQQIWRNAMNVKIVEDAGKSQTVAEMQNQLAAAGSMTLENRLTGMTNLRATLLKELMEDAKLDDDLAEAMEKRFGHSAETEYEASLKLQDDLYEQVKSGKLRKGAGASDKKRETKSGVKYQIG